MESEDWILKNGIKRVGDICLSISEESLCSNDEAVMKYGN